MAIAFDAGTFGQTATATSLTFSHTVGTEDNRVLIVGGHDTNGVSSTVTGITYDGVAMTKVNEVQCPSDRWITLWYIIAPSTGSNSVVVTSSDSQNLRFSALSYEGVSNVTATNGSDTATSSPPDSEISTAITTTVDLDWMVMFAKDNGGNNTYTSPTGDTMRLSTDIGGAAWADTGASITPAASTTMTLDNASFTDDTGALAVALQPSSGSLATTTLLVAGGGGGSCTALSDARHGGGGGGAGGMIEQSLNIGADGENTGSYAITVGDGGAGEQDQGANGDDSKITTLLSSLGGGGGGGQVSGPTSGGSGGGGTAWYVTGGTGTSGQGNNGGNGLGGAYGDGGGGGGKGATGTTAPSDGNGGNGGNGATSEIIEEGVDETYAGGGGGSGRTSSGSGGSGGGGAGGSQTGGSNATANTGGGGGGGGGSANTGGNGGSGFVAIRFLTASVVSSSGGTKTTDGDYTVHQFTEDATFEFTLSIAFDNGASAGGNGGTSQTFSHECGGTNRLLFVGAFNQESSSTVTGVTYNGVALTEIDNVSVTNNSASLWYLIAPAVGPNDVVVTRSSSSNALLGVAVSYTGCLQSGVPDSDNTGSGGSGSSLTIATTTTVVNCWLTGIFRNEVAVNSAGSNTTMRNSSSVSMGDTNAPMATAGSHSIGVTWSGSGRNVGVVASFAPAPAAVTDVAVVRNLMTLGVGR